MDNIPAYTVGTSKRVVRLCPLRRRGRCARRAEYVQLQLSLISLNIRPALNRSADHCGIATLQPGVMGGGGGPSPAKLDSVPHSNSKCQ